MKEHEKEEGVGSREATWLTDDPFRRLQVRPVVSCKLPVASCQLPVASYPVGRLPRQSGNQSCGQVVDENAKLVEPVPLLPGEMELELEPVPTIAAVP